MFFFLFFFFQAEDGIRDLVRSRGLGDVYKRQPVDRELMGVFEGSAELVHDLQGLIQRQFPHAADAVSYTHLTLPTTI